MERTAAKGAWGTVEWAVSAMAKLPAREFFASLADHDKARVLALFQRLAETGRIDNREKFKGLGERGFGLFAFKSFQIRFIGDFRPGKRFLVAHGLQKKTDELPAEAIAVAARILRENDEAERKGIR